MISSDTGEGGGSSTPTPHVNNDVKTAQTDEDQQKLNKLITQWTAMTFEDSEIPTLAKKVHSSDAEDLHHGLIGLIKLLATKNQPPIQPIIDTGVVPRLVQLISPSAASAKRIQVEAAWCLANLCSGSTEQTLYVIENGVISSFLSLLGSDEAEVIKQSVRGLGNIARNSAKFRDMILEQNGTEVMVKVLAKFSNIKLKRHGSWALRNFCNGKPAPKFELVCSAISLFCDYLKVETDSQILSDVVWGLAFITSTNKGVKSILEQNVVPRLIELLSSTDLDIQVLSLRILGNIISGTNEEASIVLKEKSFIPKLFKIIEHKKKSIRREIFWILSNITAGTPIQFEAIMGNAAYVEKIIHSAKNDVHEVKKEAIWTLANSTKTCTPAQIIRILNNGVFSCLVDLLDEQDATILAVALEGIIKCLKWGEQFNVKDESGVNKFVAEMESKGAVEKIENLQNHEASEVYNRSVEILETYFVGEESDYEEFDY